ncbi:MAG TPA: polyprenyl synthetase family protein [Candidatus Saccharimonadales bacterium]
MKADLAAILRYRPMVLEELKTYLKQRADNSDAGQADVAKRLLDFATSGKLLRGSLVCYSYALCSGENSLPPAVLNTAVALELAHASLLIHDDIIDQDELRRGQPALHMQYGQLNSAAPRLGENLALCAGDMILLLAFELLGTLGDGSLTSLVARELGTVCAGQMRDVYLTASDRPPSKRDIYDMMRAKTAGYSVALPLLAGAVLAGQPPALRRHLYRLGLAAGTLFQIRDDELGIFGNPNKLGKPVGSDVREGKKTLLYYYLWRASSPAERREWQTIFGNPQASQADISSVRRALRRHLVPERLQADTDRLKREASRHIEQLKIASSPKRELRQLVEFCGQREA